jgi:hypothetical protein
MQQLNDLLPQIMESYGFSENTPLSLLNVDDVFIRIRTLGIKEIEVTNAQMLMIVVFLGQFKDALNLFIEGRTEKFLGVKLYLNELT